MTATTTLPVLFATGVHGSRPAANAVGSGALYSCTTHSLVYQSDGASTWSTWATLGGPTATRASLGLDTTDSPQFAGLNVGAATDTTITRTGAGDVAVEGNALYRAGGTDVPVTDGGTGASTASGARTNLGISAANTPFTPNGSIAATDVQAAIQEVRDEASSGAGTVTTVKDEGSNLSTAVVSLDFVGAGVTATGTTAVTVTIPGGGGGALVFLEAHTASASSSLDFTSFISGTYDDYVFELVGIVPGTTNTDLWIRMGTGGGPTFDTGNNYVYIGQYNGIGDTFTTRSSAGTSALQLLSNLPTTANYGQANGRVELFMPGGTLWPTTQSRMNTYVGSSPYFWLSHGWYASTTALTAVRFVMSSGNIASGTIRVYGVTKS